MIKKGMGNVAVEERHRQ